MRFKLSHASSQRRCDASPKMVSKYGGGVVKRLSMRGFSQTGSDLRDGGRSVLVAIDPHKKKSIDVARIRTILAI